MAYFRMTALADLLGKLAVQGLDRCRFRFKLHAGEFDVFLFADANPYVLAFGAIGHTLYFELAVSSHTLEAAAVFPSDVYRALCAILKLPRNPGNKFTPAAFLEHLNDVIKRVQFHAITPPRHSPVPS
jgi:hypothetical protein